MSDRFADEIAETDPVCTSTEGLDDGCHFCMKNSSRYGWHTEYSKEDSTRYVTDHAPDCLWVRACAAVGKDIAPHRVAR